MHKKQRLSSSDVSRFFMRKEISMNTVGTPLLWGGFAVVVVIMLAIDLFLQGVAALTPCP